VYRFADNVAETSTATTTGAYQLAGVPSGAEPGARTFVAGVGDGNSCDYYAKEVSGTAWERGIGTVTDAATDTLTRTAVHSSSNGGAAVDWTGKTVEISAVLPARRLATDHAGLVENLTITTSRAGNAETIAIKTLAGTDPSPTDPVRIAFNTTTGGFEVLELTTALSLTISSGSTLGATSGQPFRVWLVVFNDAGTLRLGFIKCALSDGVYGLQDNVLESSTAEGGSGGADSAGVIYTGTAVTSKMMRVLGYLEYTLTTAGTWDTAPSLVRLWGRGDKLPGDTVQFKSHVRSDVIDCNVAIPYDNTAPQNTEGVEAFSVTITPTFAGSLIELDANTSGRSSASNGLNTIALFKNSDVDALAVRGTYMPSSNCLDPVVLKHFDVAASVAAITYKIRAGLHMSGAYYINGGSNGLNVWGTVHKSGLYVKEIMV
jgi:hypothetical protein